MAPLELVANATSTLISDAQKFNANHHGALVALAMAAGIIIAVAGRLLVRPIIFLAGCLPPTAFVTYLLLALFEPELISPEPGREASLDFSSLSVVEVIAAVCGLACGICISLIMVRLLFSLMVFALGVVYGTLMAAMLETTLFYVLKLSVPDVVFYGIAAVISIGTGVLSLTYVPIVLMLSTGFDGAAITAYFLGQFLGGFPNPLKLNGGLTQDDYVPALGYFLCILTLGGFGAINHLRIAEASGLFRKDVHKESEPGAVGEEEKEPLLGSIENGRNAPPSKQSGKSPDGYGSSNVVKSRYSSAHAISAAPLPSYFNNDQDKDGGG